MLQDVDVWGSTNPYERDPETGHHIPQHKHDYTKNDDYLHFTNGASDRWRSSMDNGTNPLVGLNKTFGTALKGAAILTAPWYLLNGLRTLGVPVSRNAFTRFLGKGASQGQGAAGAFTAADVGEFIQDPNVENATQILYNLLPGKNLSKPLPNLKYVGEGAQNVYDLTNK